MRHKRTRANRFQRIFLKPRAVYISATTGVQQFNDYALRFLALSLLRQTLSQLSETRTQA